MRMTPFKTWLPGTSPGCTRDVRKYVPLARKTCRARLLVHIRVRKESWDGRFSFLHHPIARSNCQKINARTIQSISNCFPPIVYSHLCHDASILIQRCQIALKGPIGVRDVRRKESGVAILSKCMRKYDLQISSNDKRSKKILLSHMLPAFRRWRRVKRSCGRILPHRRMHRLQISLILF